MGERRRRSTKRGAVRVVGMIVLVGTAGTASAWTPTPDPGAATTPEMVQDACADADGDHVLTVTDGVLALRAAAGLPSPCTPYTCDANGTGTITVTDGVGILERAAGLVPFEFYACPVPSRRRDFSNFGRFRLSRLNGLGFCAEIGSVLNVDIERSGDGSYALRIAVAAARPLGDPACIFPSLRDDETCIAPDPRPERTLTVDEAGRVRAAFSAVDVFAARDPICAIAVIDPCVIDAFDWDGFQVDDYDHDAPRIGHDTVATLVATLNALIVPAVVN